MKNKRLLLILFIVVCILLIPLISMQFTDEVNWTIGDFIIAGLLLLTSGLACDFALKKIKSRKWRIATCIGVLILLLLVWAELAVGIIGTPFA